MSAPPIGAPRGSAAAGALVWGCALAICAGFLLYILRWQYSLFYAGFAAALAGVLVAFFLGRIELRGLFASSLPLLALFAYLALSLTWSADPGLALEHYLHNLIQPVVFVVFYAIGYNAVPRQSVQLFVLYAASCLAAAAYVYLKQGAFEGEDFGSIRSTFGLVFVTSIPYLVWWIHERPAAWKWTLLLLILVTVVALRSRAAFIVAPVALLVTQYALASRAGRRTGLRWIVGGLLVLGTLGVLFVSDSGSLRFGSDALSLELSGVEEELRLPAEFRVDISRRLMIHSVLEDMAEHPFLGTGYMGTLISTLDKYGLGISAHGLPAHFAELGLLGTLIFLWAMLVFTRATAPARDPSRYQLVTRIAMVGILVVGLFHQVLESWPFYAVYALGCGYGYRLAGRAGARERPVAEPMLTARGGDASR